MKAASVPLAASGAVMALPVMNWFVGFTGGLRKQSVVEAWERAVRALDEAHLTAYGEVHDRQARALVREANQSLLENYKLDADVVAHLAALPYKYFEDSCNELKATVLQVKQMLAREEEGVANTLEHLNLEADNEQHLVFLVQELEKAHLPAQQNIDLFDLENVRPDAAAKPVVDTEALNEFKEADAGAKRFAWCPEKCLCRCLHRLERHSSGSTAASRGA